MNLCQVRGLHVGDGILGSIVMLCINNKIGSINIIGLHYCFEQLWLMNDSFLMEVDQLFLSAKINYRIVSIYTLFSIVVALYGSLISQLSLLVQEIGFIFFRKVQPILGQDIEVLGLSPDGESIIGQTTGLDFDVPTASQEPHSSGSILETRQVPDSWPPHFFLAKKILTGADSHNVDLVEMPCKHEWVDIPQEHSQGYGGLVEDVRVFEIDCHLKFSHGDKKLRALSARKNTVALHQPC